jgi:RimJ/RimL family protein N-acetyltransferase
MEWLANKSITRYLEVRFKEYSEEMAKEYIRSCISSSNIYFLKIESIPEGFIGTCTIRQDNNHKTAEIGLMIGESSLHSQGLGTKVIGLLKTFCCHELGVRKVTAGLYASNKVSLKAFLRNGFFIECRLNAQVLLEDKPEDLIRLAYFCRKI